MPKARSLTRYIPIRSLSAKDALTGLIATSSAAKEVADMLQFMPAKAAASILLLIFETIKASTLSLLPFIASVTACGSLRYVN